MTIELSKAQAQKLEQLLASGKFASREAVLERALDTLSQSLETAQDAERQAGDLEDFKAFLQAMPEGLELVQRDTTPARPVSL